MISSRYQFRSPSSFIVAGRSTARTMVASMRMAASQLMPISFRSMTGRVEDGKGGDHHGRGAGDDAGVDLILCAMACSFERPRS
jgi:hypothetical protein